MDSGLPVGAVIIFRAPSVMRSIQDFHEMATF